MTSVPVLLLWLISNFNLIAYMRNFVISIVCYCFVGCVSNENVVFVKQIESTNSIVLRMKKDKSSIFSLSYPLSFKIKKKIIGIFIMQKTLIYFTMRNLVQVQLAVI